ncbi:MAG TPA: hypothetical protein VJ622_15320 [Acidimicrobiia bacterium]|nr:hypothetical protein [Acidimicrobiia bacterium]
MPGSPPLRRALAAIAIAIAALAAVVVLPAGSAGSAGAAGAGGAGAARSPVRRVLILSLPGTTWADVAGADVPSLRALFAGAAVASTSVRTIAKQTRPGDGYVTIGAGTAAAGVAKVDGLAFDAGELFAPDGQIEAFRQRNPVTVAQGGVASIATPDLARDARHRHRGAEIGALGEALALAGVGRGVIGNADTALRLDEPGTFHREAALALADHRGYVPTGAVDRGLLRESPSPWPFGLRLDPDAVLAAFKKAWDVPGRAVVLLEASDLARAQAARSQSGAAAGDETVRRTLEATDGLIAQVLADVDLQRDAVVVTGPSDPGDGVHLTLAALRAPGVRPGLLDSATTRRPGYVTLPDLAPTVLDMLGLTRPDSMEGRPYDDHPRSWSGPPLARFIENDQEARFRDRMLGPVAGAYVAIEILLSLTVGFVLARRPGRRRLCRALDFVGLWLLAVVPLTFLGAVLDLDSVGPYLGLVIGGGVVLAAGAAALRGPTRPLVALLALLVALHVGDIVTGGHLQISTVFGYSPTVGGRFAGYGNLTYGQVAAAAIVLGGLRAHLLGGRRGLAVAAGVLLVALVADGMPFWGSDVGGVLASVPAFALVVLGLSGTKVSWRRLAALGAGAVAAVLALGFLDLRRPAGRRTHLGRLFEQIGHDGLRPFTDAVQRKIQENLSVLPTSIWIPLVPSVLAFLAWLAYGSSPRLEAIRHRAPEMRPAFVGLLVAAVLGMALNDSGIAVPAMMLGVLNPVVVRLALRTDERDLSPAPLR